MSTEVENWRIIQRHVGATPDGSPGPKTAGKLLEYFGATPSEASGTQNWKIIQRHVGANPDGQPGPKTAVAIINYLRATGGTKANNGGMPPTIPTKPVDMVPPPADTVARFPVQTEANMMKAFGPVGTRQVMLDLPFPMRISWDLSKSVTRVSCHALVHDSLKAIFEDTLKHYGYKEIQRLGLDRFGGILNVRKKRGGTTWSMHAWGIALDLWPEMNQLSWGRDKAVFAKPEYKPFFDIVRKHGWHSLGEHANYDWMHIQAAPFR
jgi:hypothetical protein